MSNTKLTHQYRCWNDCVMSGCPGHTATLEYQSVSDALHFEDGKGQHLHGQTPEFGALVSMLHRLSNARVEVESMLREAVEAKDE